ncbi:fanconi-associated nuclease 1 [Brachyhypopomus gauderio]|uniref:fanconi-associated nuclease 1 n=1 Tax=Brachyhypopomus gauderio TaxID=698409 RepID=UPI004043057E
MDSRGGRSQSKDHALPRKRLSLAKKDGSTKEKTKKPTGLSITSFFKNTPPAKLACPLCGKFIPRFKINEHIDSQCQDFVGENDIEASADDHNQQDEACATFQKNSTRCLDDERDSNMDKMNQDSKTSPYFKQNCTKKQGSPVSNDQVKVVKTISLGSLSSKLSKRVLKFSEIDSIQVSDDGETSSSQKENCDENVSVQSEPLDMDSTPASTCTLATAHLPQQDKAGERTEITGKVETLETEALQSTSTVLFRLMKRKKEGSPDARAAPVLQKKNRSATHGEHKPFPIFSQSHNSHVGLSQSAGGTAQSMKVESNRSEDGNEERKRIMTPGRSRALPQKANDGPVEQLSSRMPYYLKNFLTVLGAVLENEDDRMLFNEEDLSSIHSFKQLSVSGQMLYVRLFQRKLRWLQRTKLDYAEISSDLQPVIQELVCSGFLQTESDLEDIQDALDLLPAPELRNLAKTFHLGGPGSSTQKKQLVEGLLGLARRRSVFALAPGQNNTAAAILKRAKQLSGGCVRLRQEPRAVFSRVLLLFSLTDTLEEEEMGAGGQGQLYTVLLVNSGHLAFPAYTVQRRANIFQDRDDLIRYENAMRTLQEVVTAMQTGHWEDALGLYNSAKATWQDLKLTCDLSCQEELPVFLRCFTVGWTYTRILSRGVEILQRLRRYEDAVEELRSLLSQSVFCPDSRGRWWDRLALNLHQHLKRPEQAISAIRDGLMDPLVRTGHRLSLHQRAVRMKESATFKKLRLQLQDLPSVHVQDVPHVTIRGQLFPHEGGTGKSVFLRPAGADEGSGEGRDTMVMCSVEELALAHYRELGFQRGIHGEGSTFSTLFGLLMWNIIFMEGVPDVFRTPYQTCPLDLHTDSFYRNRQEAIETWVELLQQASAETLQSLLADTWHSQQGRVCALVNWERFSSLQEAQSLVACLGGHFLSGVFLRMAKDYRHSRGGLPDLVVWNTSNNNYKLVEVKGPNDRLSQKQQLWLDELRRLGASVEVCHVLATGARGARLE